MPSRSRHRRNPQPCPTPWDLSCPLLQQPPQIRLQGRPPHPEVRALRRAALLAGSEGLLRHQQQPPAAVLTTEEAGADVGSPAQARGQALVGQSCGNWAHSELIGLHFLETVLPLIEREPRPRPSPLGRPHYQLSSHFQQQPTLSLCSFRTTVLHPSAQSTGPARYSANTDSMVMPARTQACPQHKALDPCSSPSLLLPSQEGAPLLPSHKW